MKFDEQNIIAKSVTLFGTVSLLALAAPALAGSFTDLGTLGGSSSSPSSLSADGSVVVGRSNTSGNAASHAFRWTGGTMTDLGTLGGNYSSATGLSADGSVVVGNSYVTGNAASHAFRWTGGTMTDLGTVGGDNSAAFAVSADGSTVVGDTTTSGANFNRHAFRWTGGVMTDLGTLGGTQSRAEMVSADGSVVAGSSDTGVGFASHAFRWAGDFMTDLGTLGGINSYASGISADGSVVVGFGPLADNSTNHAFRWAEGTMSDLGTLGGNFSIARAVSADGSVVVGVAQTGEGSANAFRWTGGTMTDLGTLGPSGSNAAGVSADGSVVVGVSYIVGSSSNIFRWSQDTGMQSIQDWVADSGGEVPAGYVLSDEDGNPQVNSDGNVVIGYGNFNNHSVAWLARASGGFLSDTAAFDRSVIAAGGSAAQGGLAPANLALFGSHHRTLLDNGLAMSSNGSCAWSTVDATRNDTTGADVGLAEVGFCHDVAGLRVGLGLGTLYAKQTWVLGGNAQYHGKYMLVEIDKAFPTAGNGNIEASLLAYYSYANTRLNRAYTNGTAVDISTGSPGVRTSAVKLRLDWKNAMKLGSFAVSPYAVATWAQSRVAAYSETGGGFPASYKAARTNTTDLRLGAAFAGKINPKTDMRFGVELVHQFQNNTAGMNGAVTGLYSFNLPGQTLKSNWARMTVDVDYHLKANTVLTAGFNAATSGSDPTVGITIGLRASL